MRALVTGGTGFIGGAIAARLLASGWKVTLLLRPGAALPAQLAQAECIFSDLGQFNAADWRGRLPECELAVHAAAIRNRWGTSPEAYRRVNVDGTQQFLNALIGYAQHFIYISSVGVYGYPGMLDIREEFPVIGVRGALDYHASKLLAEQVVAQQAERMCVTILRPTITYGPGDRDGMITRMAQLIRARRMPLIGTGKNFLHLAYIDDLLDAILAAHAHRQNSGEVYNVSGPAPIRFLELARGIAAASGTTFPRFQIPRPAAWLAGWLVENLYRAAHLKTTPPITRQMVNMVSANRSFSHEKASARLGYAPQTGVNAGLPRALEWMESAGLLDK